MRILLVANEYPPLTPTGGIGTYLAGTAPAFAALGHDVHVLVCRRGQPARDQTLDGVYVHQRPLPLALTPSSPLRPRFTLRRSLGAAARRWSAELGRFDVVEYADWSAHGHDLPRSTATRRVVHLHTGIALASAYEATTNPFDLDACRRWEADAVAAADVAVAPSSVIVERSVAAGINVPPTTVIPIGVDTTRIAATELPTGPPRILVVGRLVNRKRADLVLDALAEGTWPAGTTLVLAGNAPPDRRGRRFHAELNARAAQSPVAVEFLGHVPPERIDAEYRAASVVVVPSDFESYSLVAVEALLRGRPVIASDGVGATDVLSGVVDVFPAGNRSALTDALTRAIDDRRRASEQAAAGRDLVCRDLDVTVIARRRLELYGV